MSDAARATGGSASNWPKTVSQIVWAVALFGSVLIAAIMGWTPVSIGGGDRAEVPEVVAPAAPQAVAPASVVVPQESAEVTQLKKEFADLKSTVDGQAETNKQILGLLEQLAQPSAPGTQQSAAPAPVGQPSLAQPTPSAAGADTLEIRKDVMPALLKVFRGFDGVEDLPAGVKKDASLIALFDPRCPYCHQAFTAMKGKLATYWVPTLALGRDANGFQLVQTILDAKDRLKVMDDVMNKRTTPAVASTAKAEELIPKIENEFAAVIAGAGFQRAGVPIFIVPRPNGTGVLFNGYEEGQVDRMNAVLKGEI